MITPWLDATESCTWACHVAARNPDLGDDFLWKAGTPIPAPFSGTVTNQVRQESPVLYIARITSDANPNVQVEFMHLSKFAPAGHYAAGQVMGWSGGVKGAVGSGHATGPHLHVNAVVGGKLTPIRNILTEFASVGPITTITPVNTIGDTEMQVIQRTSNGNTFSILAGLLIYHTAAGQKGDALNMAGQTTPIPRTDVQLISDVKNFGLGHLVEDGTLNFLNTMPADFTWRAPAISGGAVNLQPLSDQITALPAAVRKAIVAAP